MADVALSSEEKHFIVSGIQQDFRSDGRSCHDYRYFTVETGVISSASGSAQVKLAKTHVLLGVKAELGEPLPTLPNIGRIEFFVDCSANASPIFEGRGGDELALELIGALNRTFDAKTLDLSSLCVIPGQHCWILYIDALVLECAGNLFDTLSLAVKAALHNTRIPNLRVTGEDTEKEIEVPDDPYDFRRLDITNVPIMVTLNKIGDRYVIDATAEEEVCSDAQLLVAVNESGRITGIQKHGRGGLNPDLTFEMIEVAKRVGKNLSDDLLKVLNEDELRDDNIRIGFMC